MFRLWINAILILGQGAKFYSEDQIGFIGENKLVGKSPWMDGSENVDLNIKQDLDDDTKIIQNITSILGNQQQDKLIQNITALLNHLILEKNFNFVGQDEMNDKSILESIHYNSEVLLSHDCKILAKHILFQENPDLITITHSKTKNNETKEGVTFVPTSAVKTIIGDLIDDMLQSDDLLSFESLLLVAVLAAPILINIVPSVAGFGVVPIASFIIISATVMILILPIFITGIEVFSWFFGDTNGVSESPAKEEFFQSLNDTTIDIDNITKTVTEFVTNAPKYVN